MLVIQKKTLDDIFEHTRETYPEECCGILVGREDGNDRIVTEAHRAKNVTEARRTERYVVDTDKLIEVVRRVRRLSVDVIGFYHSHPDHPSRPSAYDKKMAPWREYSYLIVSATKHKIASVQSWVMGVEGNAFVEEAIRISGESA